jgi:hypothetical protein
MSLASGRELGIVVEVCRDEYIWIHDERSLEKRKNSLEIGLGKSELCWSAGPRCRPMHHECKSNSETLKNILLVAPTPILTVLIADCYRCSYCIASSLGDTIGFCVSCTRSLGILVHMNHVSSQGWGEERQSLSLVFSLAQIVKGTRGSWTSRSTVSYRIGERQSRMHWPLAVIHMRKKNKDCWQGRPRDFDPNRKEATASPREEVKTPRSCKKQALAKSSSNWKRDFPSRAGETSMAFCGAQYELTHDQVHAVQGQKMGC